ncbi:MAG: hypothetical protein EF813_00240 [Methanosarcinales archaeon]|nr:MAG: hypothetical protein EF813_00240 [Methanosarcinales archaeon]
MNKKLGILLFVGVIAVALFSYGMTQMDDPQPPPVKFGLGGSDSVVIKTELPEAPETMPYYRVVYEDCFGEMSPEFGRVQEFLPSEEEAVRIAEEYIESHGGMPDDAVFGNVSTGYRTHYKGDEVVEKKPVRISVGYHRVFNGMSVAGPGDVIAVVIGNNGTIIFFRKSWRHLEYAGEREILTASEAVERLQRGDTVYKLSGPIDTIEVNNIFLSYYSEVPDVKQDFYEPVWVFDGKDSYGYDVTLPVWAGVVPPKPTPSDDTGVRLTDRDDVIAPTPSDDAVISVPVSVNAPESISGTFDVTIDVKDIASMNSGQFDLSFNSSVVNVTGVSAGKIGGTTVPILGWGFMDARKIRVLFKLDGLDGVSGSGYVARIDFETRGSKGDSCVLSMSGVLLVDIEAEEIPVRWTDAEVTV